MDLQEVLNQILGYASILAILVVAVVEVFKKSFPNFPAKYLPLVALLLGVLTGGLVHLSFPLDIPVAYLLWGGGISGLASVGLFEGVKNIMKK